ncbi:MAG TPA: rod shape-determining protein MreC [Cyclobacteriaceae bacterium]|nr:rod shape-determining protein MreC [Cyclobacteriaceae bacterium]
MDRLLNFVYQYRAFFTFLLLVLFCSWLIVENNQYQSTRYFNSSNRLAANIISFSQGVREYFSLRRINSDLAEENANLRSQLERYAAVDSLYTDTTRRFDFVSAKVINNSVMMFKNYITVNKGRADGIKPGMAAISAKGAVGKVKSVSDNYAVLISLLNVDDQMSSSIKRTGHFGTAQWDGTDPRTINLNYIARHVTPQVGDTVVTSGYNAVFPPDILVGVISKVNLREEAQFWEIKVELAQDFGRLAFVEIVRSYQKVEKDSLEISTIGDIK